MLLRRLMRSHGVDYAGDSFKQRQSLSQEELNSIELIHYLWFVKILGATQAQVKNVPQYV